MRTAKTIGCLFGIATGALLTSACGASHSPAIFAPFAEMALGCWVLFLLQENRPERRRTWHWVNLSSLSMLAGSSIKMLQAALETAITMRGYSAWALGMLFALAGAFGFFTITMVNRPLPLETTPA